jgi:hypothetical protein
MNFRETGSEDEGGLNKQRTVFSSTFGFYYQRISYNWGTGLDFAIGCEF